VAVPTIGIGGSPACDGQILVIDDMLGLFTEFTPKFVTRPDRPGWYIADAEMRDILGVVYISKRAAVASIRAMPAAADAGHPLFYTVKEFTQERSFSPNRPLPMPQLCALIGVTDRTLRSCCAEFLGISPSRYVLLRRLKRVRVALWAAACPAARYPTAR